MEQGTLRKIQPAHKSKNITVKQAREAWIKIETKGSERSAQKSAQREGRSRESANAHSKKVA